MGLKGNWVDKVDGESYVLSDDINQIAHAVIEQEEEKEKTDEKINSLSDKVDGIVRVPSAVEVENGKVLKSLDGRWVAADDEVGSDASEYSIPTFDLVAIGLPTVPTDGTMVNAEADTTDIREALGKGAIKVRVSITDEGVVSYGTAILNNIYLSDGVHFCSCPLVAGTMQMTFNLVVWGDRIEASFTDLSGGGSGSGGVSSWNDLTDKPFGEENEVIFEGVLQDTLLDSDGDGANDVWENMLKCADESDAELLTGKTYKYTWDGVEYTSECFLFGGSAPAIGNKLAGGGSDDNGQPCLIFRDKDDMLGFGKLWGAALVQPPTDITISGAYPCKIEGVTVKQLDNRYLSILEGEETEEFEFMAEQTVEGFVDEDEKRVAGIGVISFPIVGHTYLVTWDGVEYKCEVFFGNGIYMGNTHIINPNYPGENTGEPFLFAFVDAAYANVFTSDMASTSHTIRIRKPATTPKIKEKYLPDMTAEQPVSVDMSAFESEGKIVETFADGTSKTTVVELNGIGNPSKITDSDGNVIEFTW